jgi:hypothetical protein
MLKIERRAIDPICPHCEVPLKKLIQVKRRFFALNRVFCCPHCRKILGFSSGTQ